MNLFRGLDAAVHDALQSGRPILTHLNADTSWLLSLPYPVGASRPTARRFFNVLIDPWLQGPQTDLASWFSRQWHAIVSSVQTIADLNTCLKDLETIARCQFSISPEHSDEALDAGPELDATRYIDMVIISHEFTDHCNRATLQEIPPDTPVFATDAAARLISSWNHFHNVHRIASLSRRKPDWRDLSPDTLPPWIGISRITGKKDRLYFHSAILISFTIRSESQDDLTEGIIYTPHGILADNLVMLSLASPRMKVLALIHGLHDIKLSMKQLNLGAHNALRAQRICGAEYWVSTRESAFALSGDPGFLILSCVDDEVKKAGGLVSHLLKRKIWTIEDVLKDEQRRNGKTGVGSPLDDIQDVHFANLDSGESLVLR